MTDIVDRLEIVDIDAWSDPYSCRARGKEAAAEITRLRADLAAAKSNQWPDEPDTEISGYRAYTAPDGSVWVNTSINDDMCELCDHLRSRAEAAEAREAKLREALKHLERAATVTIRYGAVTGSHWTKLTTANLLARAALSEKGGAT